MAQTRGDKRHTLCGKLSRCLDGGRDDEERGCSRPSIRRLLAVSQLANRCAARRFTVTPTVLHRAHLHQYIWHAAVAAFMFVAPT